MQDREFRVKNMNSSRICDFFCRVGVCRHGTSCSREHPSLKSAGTILVLPNLLNIPYAPQGVSEISPNGEAAAWLERRYEDLFIGFSTFGTVTNMVFATNAAAQLSGTVYVQFASVLSAQRAYEELPEHLYDGRRIIARYLGRYAGNRMIAADNIEQTLCKSRDDRSCSKGASCNYVHGYVPPAQLVQSLKAASAKVGKPKYNTAAHLDNTSLW